MDGFSHRHGNTGCSYFAVNNSVLIRYESLLGVNSFLAPHTHWVSLVVQELCAATYRLFPVIGADTRDASASSGVLDVLCLCVCVQVPHVQVDK